MTTKSRLYDKLDLEKYGNLDHQTSVIVKLGEMAYIKKNYHSLRNFIKKMVEVDKEKNKVVNNG